MRSWLPAIASATPEEVEQALASVFARPEFEPPPESAIQRWFGEAWREFWEFVLRSLPSFSLDGGGRSVVFWAVVGLLVLAAGVITLRFTRRLARRRSGKPGRQQRPEPEVGRVNTPPLTAEAWDHRARALAEEGRWREAALALYQALLLRLDARGVVRVESAKTPGDYRRETRGHPTEYRLLTDFLRAFEPIAFGGRGTDAVMYERLREAASSRAAWAPASGGGPSNG